MPKVRVPQKDGEIVVLSHRRTEIDEPRSHTYNVSGGEVTVAAADLDEFLAAVEGSKEAPAETAPSKS